MTRRERAKALKALYAHLPRVKCQRKCWDGCGTIIFSDLERDMAQQKAGKRMTIVAHPLAGRLPMCSMLSNDGDCTVHPVRPMICRLYGVIPELPCEHGCEIEPGPLAEGEWKEFFGEAMRLGGDSHAQTIKPYIDFVLSLVKQ